MSAAKFDQFVAEVYAALAPAGTIIEAMLSYCIVVTAMVGGVEPSMVIVTLLVEEPHWKAWSPIDVTLAGTVMLVRLWQS